MHLARFCHMPLNPPCLDLWQVAVCAEWSTFRQKCITQKCSSNTFCWVAIGSARAGLLRISLTIFFLPVLQHICIWMVWEDLIWCLSRGQASLEEVLLLLVAKLLTQPPAFLMLHMLAVFRISHVFQVFYHLKERTHTLAGHEYDVLRPFSVEFTTSFTHVKSRESHNIDVVHKNGTSNVNYRFGLVLNLKPRQDFVCCPPMWSCPSVMASCRWSSMDWEVCCFCWIWPPVVGFGWTDMIVGCEWYDVDNVENVGKI